MLTALYLFAIVLLVLANGFFVAAEFALVGLRRSRIETLAANGDRRAKRLISVLDNLNAYLSASQLGITLASLGLGWVGEPTVAPSANSGPCPSTAAASPPSDRPSASTPCRKKCSTAGKP